MRHRHDHSRCHHPRCVCTWNVLNLIQSSLLTVNVLQENMGEDAVKNTMPAAGMAADMVVSGACKTTKEGTLVVNVDNVGQLF